MDIWLFFTSFESFLFLLLCMCVIFSSLSNVFVSHIRIPHPYTNLLFWLFETHTLSLANKMIWQRNETNKKNNDIESDDIVCGESENEM